MLRIVYRKKVKGSLLMSMEKVYELVPVGMSESVFCSVPGRKKRLKKNQILFFADKKFGWFLKTGLFASRKLFPHLFLNSIFGGFVCNRIFLMPKRRATISR